VIPEHHQKDGAGRDGETDEGRLHPRAGGDDCEEGREGHEALERALGNNLLVEREDDHAEEPAESVGTRGDEGVVDVIGGDHIIPPDIVVVQGRVREGGGQAVEDLGDNGAEPEEAHQKVHDGEDREGRDDRGLRDAEVFRQARPKEDRHEAANREGRGVGAGGQEGLGQVTGQNRRVVGGLADETWESVAEPR
jgi:hypothetical protein